MIHVFRPYTPRRILFTLYKIRSWNEIKRKLLRLIDLKWACSFYGVRKDKHKFSCICNWLTQLKILEWDPFFSSLPMLNRRTRQIYWFLETIFASLEVRDIGSLLFVTSLRAAEQSLELCYKNWIIFPTADARAGVGHWGQVFWLNQDNTPPRYLSNYANHSWPLPASSHADHSHQLWGSKTTGFCPFWSKTVMRVTAMKSQRQEKYDKSQPRRLPLPVYMSELAVKWKFLHSFEWPKRSPYGHPTTLGAAVKSIVYRSREMKGDHQTK